MDLTEPARGPSRPILPAPSAGWPGRGSASVAKTRTVANCAAIVTYLDFAEEHALLAGEIADAAAARASAVGSGRVGRTSTLTVAEKAELAARAHIRHHHTDYEDELASVMPEAPGRCADDDRYLDARANALLAVDEFLAAHRRPL